MESLRISVQQDAAGRTQPGAHAGHDQDAIRVAYGLPRGGPGGLLVDVVASLDRTGAQDETITLFAGRGRASCGTVYDAVAHTADSRYRRRPVHVRSDTEPQRAEPARRRIL